MRSAGVSPAPQWPPARRGALLRASRFMGWGMVVGAAAGLVCGITADRAANRLLLGLPPVLVHTGAGAMIGAVAGALVFVVRDGFGP